MRPRRMEPPKRKTGRGGGRKVDPALVKAMRVVANNPDEWYLIAEYASRGSASSAASRIRRRDWNMTLGLPLANGGVWNIVSRTYDARDDGAEGAGVWARRVTRA